ncbi:MAG: DEAD/DEAH box helicase [Chloroflexota bacterium]
MPTDSATKAAPPTGSDTHTPLASFLEPTRLWFQKTLGQPTPPQAQGWPAIQRRENTLILAPTGSGKTLSAFLWGIDQIYRTLIRKQNELKNKESKNKGDQKRATKAKKSGRTNHELYLLYISPLKALNNDIERNLRVPLAGISETARELGMKLPEINVAVRSGDTPQRERQAMLRKPPHILITTPESLYLMLTGPKSLEIFSTVRTVIVDEIHTLAGSKRGVHLSLSLERLQRVAHQPIQRIGLSATIQPLEEVARYLGGNEWEVGSENGEKGPVASKRESENPSQNPANQQIVNRQSLIRNRPVTIVDAAYQKDLDLLVETVVEDFQNLPGDSIWPAIIPRTVQLIDAHQSTLIFVNNRRLAERTADRLNAQIAAQEQGIENALIEDGLGKGLGMMASGMGEAPALIRSHHGSISKEVRLLLERELKAGKLPALVGTSSLELGIDIGAIDLVVQYHSPKTVAEGLQRVGRSGHLVGQTSKGRIFPTHREDIMEAAAVAGGMLRGDVEPTHTPRNPLDILAQQIVAMVSVEDWSVDELYDLIRQSYAYQDLTHRVFTALLEMLSGRYPSNVHRNLRARLVWDKVNNQLAALPGTRLLALTNGGAITDRGTFGAYLSDGRTKLGDLDEEFVYETRVGDTFILGSQVWRVTELTDDKVMVTHAPGATPRMPFWRGDFAWRPYDLGSRVGAFRRAVEERLGEIVHEQGWSTRRTVLQNPDEPSVQAMLQWLQDAYALDVNSCWHVIEYVASQLDHAGAISSDKTILVEFFEDAIGDPRMVIQAPFGGRVNGLWALVLAGALRERTGVDVEIQTSDEGILFRFPDSDADFPLDLITDMTPAKAREYIFQELPNSAVFGAQFRQNAARALLLPGLGAGKRTPFWLQRMRAKDLLQVVRQLDDFPIVAETYRDCLEDVMDLPSLEKILTGIQQGEIEVVPLESLHPSPVASGLLWRFIEEYMYEWDAPKSERQLQTAALNRDLLQDLLTGIDLSELLRTEAVDAVRARLQHTTPETQARSLEELALLFQNLGDLTASEIAARTLVDPSSWIAELAADERITEFTIPTSHGPQSRWVYAEYRAEYREAFTQERSVTTQTDEERSESVPPSDQLSAARQSILHRYLNHVGPVTQEKILARYAFPSEWLKQELARLIDERALVHGHFTPFSDNEQSHSSTAEGANQEEGAEYIDRQTLEQMHRSTLTILRNEVQPVSFTTYVDFLIRWQHLHPETQLSGTSGLHQILQQLRAAPLIGRIWERDVLALRVADYRSSDLAELCQSGDVVWVGAGGADPQRGRLRFFYRGEGRSFLEEPAIDLDREASQVKEVEESQDEQEDHAEGKHQKEKQPEDEQDNAKGISDKGREVYQFLRSEGAVFLADLRAGLGLGTEEAEGALMELAMAGLVTNDSLAILHTQLAKRRSSSVALSSSSTARRGSSLEAQLAERMGKRSEAWVGGSRRPNQREFRAAKQRVRERMVQNTPPTLSSSSTADNRSSNPSHSTSSQSGRWTLVHRIGVLGRELPASERVARQVRQLLARYGVVTRKSLENEKGSWEWSAIYQELQRLELRGEIRRGYFVKGLPGVQFASTEVLDQLRGYSSKQERQEDSDWGVSVQADSELGNEARRELVLLNACDPANVFALAEFHEEQSVSAPLPLAYNGAPIRFARIPSTWLVLDSGLPILLIEETGGSITTIQGVEDLLTKQALQLWMGHALRFESRITVNHWNDSSVLNSDGQPLLEALGFYREYPGMIKER